MGNTSSVKSVKMVKPVKGKVYISKRNIGDSMSLTSNSVFLFYGQYLGSSDAPMEED